MAESDLEKAVELHQKLKSYYKEATKRYDSSSQYKAKYHVPSHGDSENFQWRYKSVEMCSNKLVFKRLSDQLDFTLFHSLMQNHSKFR